MKKTSFIATALFLGAACAYAESESMKDRLNVLIKEDAKDPNKKIVEPPKKKDDEDLLSPKKAGDEKPKETAEKPKTKEGEKDKVVAMPQVKVEGKKETETTYEAKKLVEKLDKEIEREKKNTTPTEADKALNNSKISYLGDRSAAASADQAKLRVREMEMKESVAAIAVDPNDDKENKELLKMLQDLEYKKKRSEDTGSGR